MEELNQRLAPSPKTLNRHAVGVHSDNVEDVLPDVDAVDVSVTRLVAHHDDSPSGVHASACGEVDGADHPISGDARRSEGRCDRCARGAGYQQAAGLFDHLRGSQRSALPPSTQ